jgi:hypothetical protein
MLLLNMHGIARSGDGLDPVLLRLLAEHQSGRRPEGDETERLRSRDPQFSRPGRRPAGLALPRHPESDASRPP